jgi:TPP-dependent pyruvate/acetoin dehydrogenase alpha subunit
VAARAEAFGIHTETIDGQDVQVVHAKSLAIVERARSGEGPTFLQCNTYRFHGHHVGDIDRSYYRPKTEEEEWKSKRDPVKLLAEWLQKSEMADSKLLDQIQAEIATHIKESVDFALNAPYPDPIEVNQHVYA